MGSGLSSEQPAAATAVNDNVKAQERQLRHLPAGQYPTHTEKRATKEIEVSYIMGRLCGVPGPGNSRVTNTAVLKIAEMEEKLRMARVSLQGLREA